MGIDYDVRGSLQSDRKHCNVSSLGQLLEVHLMVPHNEDHPLTQETKSYKSTHRHCCDETRWNDETRNAGTEC